MTDTDTIKRLKQFVQQYDDEHSPGASLARTTLRCAITLAKSRPGGLDLAAMQGDVRRLMEIVQAFGGMLARLEQERKDGMTGA